MRKNKQAFSLIVAMIIVLVSSLLAFTIIEYILPFARNIKGIENATKAYYYANSGVEKGLYFFSTRPDDKIKEELNIDFDSVSIPTGYSITTLSSGPVLPDPGKGTSKYDNNYNTISIGNPIQISVGNGFVQDINNLMLKVRVPQSLGELEQTKGYMSWMLSGGTGSIASNSGTIIKGNQVNDTYISIGDRNGSAYSTGGTEVTGIVLKDIFNKLPNDTAVGNGGGQVPGIGCVNSNTKCILSFSVINLLQTVNDVNLPYLEWKIESIGASKDQLPLRYSHINTQGRSYGFGRSLHVRYPQDTVNQALDFAVFQ